MGHTKSELHPPHRNQQSNVFKALGHPARIAIIEYIVKHNSALGPDLMRQTQLAQSSFAQHMRMLLGYKLLHPRYVGKELHYRLNDEMLELVRSQLDFWKKD